MIFTSYEFIYETFYETSYIRHNKRQIKAFLFYTVKIHIYIIFGILLNIFNFNINAIYAFFKILKTLLTIKSLQTRDGHGPRLQW